MSDAPGDLRAFRAVVQQLTGLTDPADVGIVGDGAHQHTGGYHEGRDVLAAIGRYHPGAPAGALTEDYSCRLARDRRGLSDHASAMDVAAGWPHGGRDAWLRYNRLLVAALHAGDPALAALRAVNYSPDGVRRLRTDRERGWAVETSGDTVTIHTHHEWYRDTDGRRGPCLTRMAALITQAITGHDPEGDMTPDEHASLKHVETQVSALFPEFRADLAELRTIVTGIATKVGLTPDEVAQLRQAAADGAQQGVTASVGALAAAVVAKLPPTGLTAADVEAALREVLRSGVDT